MSLNNVYLKARYMMSRIRPKRHGLIWSREDSQFDLLLREEAYYLHKQYHTITSSCERKMTPMLLPACVMVLLHFQVGLSLCVISTRTSEELISHQWLLSSFKSEHLEGVRTCWSAPISPSGKPMGFHIVGWKYLVRQDTPTMMGWIHRW